MSSVVVNGLLNFRNVAGILSGGLPIRSAAGFPCKISKEMCILKSVIHFGDVRLVLLTLKYRMVPFRAQNKIVLLSAAPPIRLTLRFFHHSNSH